MTDPDASADAADQPTPPDALEESVATTLVDLAKRDSEQLPAVAAYAEDLAGWIESRDSGIEGGDDEDTGEADSGTEDDESADEPTAPDGVPERATVTVTEIGGTEYRYYQWRDGDEIRSKTVEV